MCFGAPIGRQILDFENTVAGDLAGCVVADGLLVGCLADGIVCLVEVGGWTELLLGRLGLRCACHG